MPSPRLGWIRPGAPRQECGFDDEVVVSTALARAADPAQGSRRGFAAADSALDAAVRWALRSDTRALGPDLVRDAELAHAHLEDVCERLRADHDADAGSSTVDVSVGRTALTEDGPRQVEGFLFVLVVDGNGDVLCRTAREGARPLSFAVPVH